MVGLAIGKLFLFLLTIPSLLSVLFVARDLVFTRYGCDDQGVVRKLFLPSCWWTCTVCCLRRRYLWIGNRNRLKRLECERECLSRSLCGVLQAYTHCSSSEEKHLPEMEQWNDGRREWVQIMEGRWTVWGGGQGSHEGVSFGCEWEESSMWLSLYEVGEDPMHSCDESASLVARVLKSMGLRWRWVPTRNGLINLSESEWEREGTVAVASEEGECRTGWIRLFGRTRPTMEPSGSVITV